MPANATPPQLEPKPESALLKSPSYLQRTCRFLTPPVLFALLTIVFTYPIIFQFASAVPGRGVEDRLQNLWNFWWIRHALENWQNPYLTDLLFFPYYQSPNPPLPLYFHTLQLFNGVITLPLQRLWGLAAAYNGVVLFATWLSGLGTYWLVRKLGGSRVGGIVAGAVFAFAPIRLNAINESITNIQSTEFLPLYAFFLHSAFFEPRYDSQFWSLLNKKMVLGAVISLTFCIYTDWYNTIYLLAYSLLFYLWKSYSGLKFPRNLLHQFAFQALIGGSTFLLVSPLLLPSITNLSNPAFRTVLGYDREVNGSTTLDKFLLPISLSPDFKTTVLSYTALVMAVIGVVALFPLKNYKGWLSRSTGFYWATVTLAAVIMSLGPELRLSNEANTGLPLPYALFRLLPAVSITRAPGRFIILAMLGVSVLSGLAIDWLLLWKGLAFLIKRPKLAPVARIFLPLFIIGLLTLEVWRPLITFEVKPNPFMQTITREQEAGNLLELPITRHYNHDHFRMYNQITHGRAIVGGYLSRPVIDPYRSPDSPFQPVADLVLRGKRQPEDIIPATTNAEDLDNLVALYNFHYILIYPKEYAADTYQRDGVITLIEQHYGVQQLIYKDSEMLVYQVPQENMSRRPRNVSLYLGSGWYPLERDKSSLWRWSSGSSKVYATSVATEEVEVQVRVRSFEVSRRLEFSLNGVPVYTSQVPVGEPINLSFKVMLSPGRNTLSLESGSGEQASTYLSNDSRRLTFAVNSISFG